MSQNQEENMGLMEKSYLVFEKAGHDMHVPAPFPHAPDDLYEHISQAIAFARENPSISFQEAAEKVEAGETLPEIDNPLLSMMLDIWERTDANMGSFADEEKTPRTKTMVDRLREGGNPQSEKEITLARIYDTFHDLNIRGIVGLEMKNTLQGQVIYGQTSLGQANKILDCPEMILQIAEIHKQAHEIQRRYTLLHLAEQDGFIPKSFDGAQYLISPSVSRILGRAVTISAEEKKKFNRLHYWRTLPISVVGGLVSGSVLSSILDLPYPFSSFTAYAESALCYPPGAVVFGIAAHFMMRNNKHSKNLKAIRKPILVIDEYIEKGLTKEPMSEPLRNAVVELRDVLDKISPPAPK